MILSNGINTQLENMGVPGAENVYKLHLSLCLLLTQMIAIKQAKKLILVI